MSLKGDVNVPRRGKEVRIKGKKVWEERERTERTFGTKEQQRNSLGRDLGHVGI